MECREMFWHIVVVFSVSLECSGARGCAEKACLTHAA